LSGCDVPHLDSGVGIARDENVLAQLHAGGQTLMTHQGVLAIARLHVPHADGGVQRARNHMEAIKLELRINKEQINKEIHIKNFE